MDNEIQSKKLNRSQKPVIANISNRHMHLCLSDLEKLFGQGYKLTKKKDLIQPGEHSCLETVKLIGKKGQINRVRILGPLRKSTQVEISMTDNILIGAGAPIRISGDLKGSSPIKIVGTAGEVDLTEGCIVAKRHVHMSLSDADLFGLKDGELISIKTQGERGLIFDNVVARICDKMVLECHLDTDEANAAGLKNGDKILIL